MFSSPFAEVATELIARGYSALPLMPGEKTPGKFGTRDGWRPMDKWNQYCFKLPFPNVVAEWAKWPDAGVGVALGMGLICIDIDQEEIVGPMLEILPVSPVQKKGRKGISLFYRGDTEKIRSRNFRTPERVGLLDLLAEGKQTVLPPSIHPDTGEPYYWWTDDTLMDVSLEDLPELPDNIGEQIGEVLKAFGYDPDHERAAVRRDAAQRAGCSSTPEHSVFRWANDCAMGNLDCWVPGLLLYKLRRKPGGYSAVATWRPSGSGRPLDKRKLNLSIVGIGIKDFGTGDTYSPVDLVMAARECDRLQALNWLLERLPQEPQIVLRK